MSEAMAAVERAVRFGIKINKNEEDSNKRVTYLYDAARHDTCGNGFCRGYI